MVDLGSFYSALDACIKKAYMQRAISSFVLAPLPFGFDATSREGVSPKDVFFHSIQRNS